MIDLIDANEFANFAHFRLLPEFPGDQVSWDSNIINQNSIIFVKRGLLDMFFQHIQGSTKKHILITHLGDEPITKEEFDKKPPCVVKWFAQNVAYDHPDLIPIPIGLENKTGICKEDLVGRRDWFVENLDKLIAKEKNTEEVYCNWEIIYNPEGRDNVLSQLNTKYVWKNKGYTYSDYWNKISEYKFIICPAGRLNSDTIRLWEALYIGCFPVAIKHPAHKEYTELPIIQVDNWSEVTPELLQSSLNKTYNMEMLYMPYWIERITNEFNKL